MRPTQREPEGVRTLADDEVPDFLERHRVALLAFLDPQDAVCAKMDARLRVVAAKWEATAGTPQDPAAARLRSFGAAEGRSPEASRTEFGAGVVDVTLHRLVAEAVGVTAVPTVLLFADGHVADRLLGGVPESILDEAVRARMGRARG